MRTALGWLVLALAVYGALRWAGCVGPSGSEGLGGGDPAAEVQAKGRGPDVANSQVESEATSQRSRDVDGTWVEVLLDGRGNEAPPPSAPAGAVERWERLAAADPVERWRAWSEVLEEGLVPQDRKEAFLDGLEQLARRALRSDALSFEVVVRPGDALVKIARRVEKEKGHPVAVGLIRWLNGLRGDLIHPGQRLRIPSEPVRIEVLKSRFLLRVRIDGGIVREFPVGIGREGKTPEGEWSLKEPLEHPPWKDPESGRIYVWGDPEYAIGTRWIGFAGEGEALGLGIHGTNEPESIGKAASLGCIRLRNEDVERLAEWVTRGIKVQILEG